MATVPFPLYSMYRVCHKRGSSMVMKYVRYQGLDVVIVQAGGGVRT